jgi:hypothetical protein
MENLIISDYFYIPLLIGLSFAVDAIPYINRPFQWIETYFHELSHGLMCILTGGRIHRIQINWDSSGHCAAAGGFSVFILLAGYIGATAWGLFIFLGGWFLGAEGNSQLLYILIGILGVVTLFWVRHVVTLVIVIIMGAIFYLPTLFSNWEHLHYIVEFIGVHTMVNALHAPLHLIDGKHEGDGAMLADRLLLPEGVWIALWLVIAIAALFWLWLFTLPVSARFDFGFQIPFL